MENLKRGMLVLSFAAALLLSACSAGSDESNGAGTTVSETDGNVTRDAANAPAVPTRGALPDGERTMAASSPFGAYFANDGGFEAAIQNYTIRVEEEIKVCMAEEGFQFAVTGSGFGTNYVEERKSDLTVREWTTQFGFGVSTSFDSIAKNQASDPNVEVFIRMSESERELWAFTLNGVGVEDFRDNPFNTRPLDEQGCIGEALIATGAQEALEGFDGFVDELQELEDALSERSEMIEVVTAWSRCMSEAGYPNYGTLDEPEEDIHKRFTTLTAPLQVALSNLSDEAGQALISGESLDIADLPDLDVTALRELQQEEVALALAHLNCYEAEVQTTYEPLRDALENSLIDEFATEFEELRNLGS